MAKLRFAFANAWPMMKLEPDDGSEHAWQDFAGFSHLFGLHLHPILTAIAAIHSKAIAGSDALEMV